jgi:hypothetical protein
MQQRYKGLRLKRAITIRKQESCYRGRQTGSRAGDHRENSQVFRLDSKNECQGTVEEPATSQTKEETTHSFRARYIGAPTTLGNFALTDRKRRNGGTPVDYSGRIALRREQSGMSAVSQDYEASRDSRC